MHEHGDLRLKPGFVASLERPGNTGWNSYIVRAPLNGATSLLPLVLALPAHRHVCSLLCDWDFEFMTALFSIPFLEIYDATLKFWESG